MKAKFFITIYIKKECPLWRGQKNYIFAKGYVITMFKKQRKDEIRLKSLPASTAELTKIICGNLGISISSHLKKYFREIADQYPEEMKKPRDKRALKEVRIRGISEKLLKELYNIADNSGADLIPFLNTKLTDLIIKQPERMKKKLDF